MTTFNANNTSYEWSINDDAEELAYNIWEANRSLAIATATGDKKLAQQMKRWLKELGYDLSSTDAAVAFYV